MSLKLVIDMNLSVEWVGEFARHGFDAVHWTAVGDPRVEDAVIMDWARSNGRIVFTHDLGFGTTLSLTHATGPSVIQVRTQRVLPEDVGPLVVAVLHAHSQALAAGCLVVVEEKASLVRLLPLER